MNSFVRYVGTSLLSLGFDPRRTLAAARGIPSFLLGSYRFLRQRDALDRSRFSFRLLPVLSDLHMPSGTATGHYFHQDLWAAREVFARNPQRHVDVGSRIDGFVAHLLSFRDTDVIDIRKLASDVPGLRFIQADLMNAPDDELATLAADSVSCLHALEHFGLGRYGDPIDANGWRKGLAKLARLVRPAGRLLLSVPIGRPRVEFNAQRIFSPQVIIDEAAANGLTFRSMAIIRDDGSFSPNASADTAADLDFGCGCFVFERDRTST